jgi:peptidoglycan hydrolase CwlO-like protein
MPRDDRLKKVQEAGADFLETARTRAEEFLRELSRAGGGTQGSLNELLKESRRGTEQLVATIRSEIRSQLNALGLATKADVARMARKVQSSEQAPAQKTAAQKTTGRKAPAKKTAAKKTAAKKTAAKKTAARKAPAKKTAG